MVDFSNLHLVLCLCWSNLQLSFWKSIWTWEVKLREGRRGGMVFVITAMIPGDFGWDLLIQDTKPPSQFILTPPPSRWIVSPSPTKLLLIFPSHSHKDSILLNFVSLPSRKCCNLELFLSNWWRINPTNRGK